MKRVSSDDPDPKVGDLARSLFDGLSHDDLKAVYEHGHWWLVCSPCGAQYSVVDCVGGPTDPFDYEAVSVGDGSCDEKG